MVESKTFYNLAQIMFDNELMVSDSFKMDDKIESRELTASNKHVPYGVIFGKESHDFEITDLDPVHRPFFKNIFDRQEKNPNDLAEIGTYVLNKGEKHLLADKYYKAWVTDISKDMPNLPFTVKGKCAGWEEARDVHSAPQKP